MYPFVYQLLAYFFPAPQNEEISPLVLSRHLGRFKRLYAAQIVIVLLSICVLPAVIMVSAKYWARYFIVSYPDALFASNTDYLNVGAGFGVCLGMGLAGWVANQYVRLRLGSDMADLYFVWYSRLYSGVDGEAFARFLLRAGLFLLFVVEFWIRYDYTILRPNGLVVHKPWYIKEETRPLNDIQGLEIEDLPKKRSEEYGFSRNYRIQFHNYPSWEVFEYDGGASNPDYTGFFEKLEVLTGKQADRKGRD